MIDHTKPVLVKDKEGNVYELRHPPDTAELVKKGDKYELHMIYKQVKQIKKAKKKPF